jgi:hypothetical protein
MRVALGIAVFSGMLGVTFFGLFLTPVFYVIIRWLSARKAEAPRPEPRRVVAVEPVAADGPHIAPHGITTGDQAGPPHKKA